LFHAGNAHGVHPSELFPLRLPYHLSAAVALLTLTCRGFRQRPTGLPPLNNRLDSTSPPPSSRSRAGRPGQDPNAFRHRSPPLVSERPN
jgi:hypothetical protein